MPHTSSKYSLEFRTWLHVILTQNIAPFPESPGKCIIQQEASSHQQNGLKFKEEVSKVLDLEHNFA
jgi:hypothetical protein